MRIHRLGELATPTIETDNTIPDLAADSAADDLEFAGGTEPESAGYDPDELAIAVPSHPQQDRPPLVQRFLQWVTGATSIVSSGDIDEEAPTVERQSPFHDSSKPSEQDGYYYYGEDVVTSAKLD